MSGDNQVYQLNPMFRLQWEQAQDCFVLLYPEGMIKLNGGAGEIMATIDGERSQQQVISTLEEKFPGAEGLADDVREFIGVALEQRWLEAKPV